MKVEELRIGLRVSVPAEKLREGWPWQERYGEIVEIETFFDSTLVLVNLDGQCSTVLSLKPEELDYE